MADDERTLESRMTREDEVREDDSWVSSSAVPPFAIVQKSILV